MSPTGTGKKTRAELVRARRQIQQAPRKPLPRQQSKQPASNYRAHLKTISRQPGSYPASKVYTRQPAARRQVYMPLGTPGAEVKLPSLPNIQIGWRLVSGILAIAMLILVIGFKEMDLFQVSGVHLVGAQRLDPEELAGKLEITDESIAALIPAEIENKVLKEFHDVKIVKVSLGLPAKVTISIQERVPAVLWISSDGSTQWIDDEGYMFKVRGEATLPVPVQATADAPSPFNSSAEALTAVEALLSDEDEYVPSPDVEPSFVQAILSLHQVLPAETTMIYDPAYGLGWNDPRGWKVYFGSDMKQIELKLAEYEVIVNRLVEKRIQPALISLEFLHAPFYRLEQ